MNPIKNSFSKIKNVIKSRLRLGETGVLHEMIISEISNVSPDDCAGYFRNILKNILIVLLVYLTSINKNFFLI